MTQGHRNIDPRLAWLDRHANGWQDGELGIIDALVSGLQMEPGYCLEFGIGDPDKTQLTVSRLITAGWRAVLIEGHPDLAQKASDDLGEGVLILNRMVGLTGEDTIDAILSGCIGFPRSPASRS